MTPGNRKYKRVILELSGEMFRGELSKGRSVDFDFLRQLSRVLVKVCDSGLQLGVVVGGGNIWRGSEHPELEQVTSHQIGMLATIMNGLALRESILLEGGRAVTFAPFKVGEIAQPYPRHELMAKLSAGEIVIFSGGTGNPFFTTDTGAVLRGLEIGADAVLKATKVDGLYSDDPIKNPRATRYSRISVDDALRLKAGVMDLTAFALAAGKGIEIVIFKLLPFQNILDVINGEDIGTVVTCDNK